MRVDGYRFDLAPTLARQYGSFDRVSSFLSLVFQYPVLAGVKLIAEPWDVGEGGYRLGGHGPGWGDGIDRFRDTMRDFWHGEGGLPPTSRRSSGVVRPVRGRRAGTDLVGQLGRGPRRLHARRPVSYAASTTRPTARTTGTAPATTAPGTGVSKARATDPSILAPGRRQSRPCWPRCCSRWHADARHRRRIRPHPTRQQQRLLPGQPDHLVRLVGDRRGPARRHPGGRSWRSDRPIPCAGGAGSWSARRPRKPLWFTPAGTTMTPAEWGFERAAPRSISTAPTHRTWRRTAARCSTMTSCYWSTPGWGAAQLHIRSPPGQTWLSEIDALDPAAARSPENWRTSPIRRRRARSVVVLQARSSSMDLTRWPS